MTCERSAPRALARAKANSEGSTLALPPGATGSWTAILFSVLLATSPAQAAGLAQDLAVQAEAVLRGEALPGPVLARCREVARLLPGQEPESGARAAEACAALLPEGAARDRAQFLGLGADLRRLSGDVPTAIQLWMAAAEALIQAGEGDRALDSWMRAQAAASAAGLSADSARIQLAEARWHRSQGRGPQAAAALSRALDQARRARDKALQAAILEATGDGARADRDPLLAFTAYARAQTLYQEIPDPLAEARILAAQAALQAEDPGGEDLARRLRQTAMEKLTPLTKAEDPDQAAAALSLLADLAELQGPALLRAGDPQQALDALGVAFQARQNAGTAEDLVRILDRMRAVALASGEEDLAERYAARAAALLVPPPAPEPTPEPDRGMQVIRSRKPAEPAAAVTAPAPTASAPSGNGAVQPDRDLDQ